MDQSVVPGFIDLLEFRTHSSYHLLGWLGASSVQYPQALHHHRLARDYDAMAQ